MAKIDIGEVRSQLIASQEKLPAEVPHGDGVFLPLNQLGGQVPIFWCFNNWVEPLSLAFHLGPDQPLFATRSFHNLLSGKAAKKANVTSLATLYVEELLGHYQSGPLILGGNCQAAPVVEAMAHRLLTLDIEVPTLVILEHQLDYFYPGYVLHLFGAASEDYNPFLRGLDPTERWRRQFGATAWGAIDGKHGQFFRAPAIHQLCGYLRMTVAACRDGKDLPTGNITNPKSATEA
mgnify:CR=1 FL=1